MPIHALLHTFAAGVLIVASADAAAANATGHQTAAAFAGSTMSIWAQAAQAIPRARPLMAQLFADSRGEQAACIRAQMEQMEARARANDHLDSRVQPRNGDGHGDWQQQERIRQERGNGGQENWHGPRHG